MNNTEGSLSSRALGGFPLSVSTSLAFESVFPARQTPYDPERVIPNNVNIANYDECWINISTLFRNLQSATDKESFQHSDPLSLKSALLQEIEVIDSLFMNEGKGACKPQYYYCTFKSLRNKTDISIGLRTETTDNQKFYKHLHDKTMELITKDNDVIFKFDTEIKAPKRSNAVILTHYPYELLSYKNFNKMDLIESNTGKLKPRFLWNSKYYPLPNEDMSILPFTRKFLLVFGDKTTIIPSPFKLRKLILEIAKKRNWTSMTTKDKIITDLEIDIKEPFVLAYLKKL